MVVPWSGFPLKALVDFAKPTSNAKYLRMETFKNPKIAPGQRQTWYPWPYAEGLTLAEATNELAFIVTGVFGKPAPPQMGAPLMRWRLRSMEAALGRCGSMWVAAAVRPSSVGLRCPCCSKSRSFGSVVGVVVVVVVVVVVGSPQGSVVGSEAVG